MNSNSVYIPEYVSMTQMAKLLNLSRSRLYQLISEEILLPPIYSLNNKRPLYTSKMVRRNLEVKKNNVGINGQIIIFYSAKSKLVQTVKKTKKKSQSENSKYEDLIDELEALGITDIKSSQIE